MRRVGVKLVDGGVPREGCSLFSLENEQIGHLTSGAYSATLKKGIGMGYIDVGFKNPGSEILVDIRGRKVKAVVEKLPMVPTHYYQPKA